MGRGLAIVITIVAGGFLTVVDAATQLKSEHVSDVGKTVETAPYMVLEHTESLELEVALGAQASLSIEDARP